MPRSRSKRSPSRAPAAKAAAPAPPSIPKGRLWLFRLSAMILGPLFCLLLLEGGLRLAGVGHPMSFYLPAEINGKKCFVENDRFGWRFFGPDMARAPFPFVIPAVKPPDTVRVFVFGESAAYGDPQPEFGMCRILEALLNGRYPDKHFEVVNTAMTAINSHVILPIARDTAKRNGDFWVIYMGNNEVVGPFGSGTVFGPKAANLSLIRAGIAFKATRTGQALGNLARSLQKRAPNQSEWGGMAMFMKNHVAVDDPRMETVYNSFEDNLGDIINAGMRSGAKVLVSTVVRNLKDCGPFASDHKKGLTAEELDGWNKLFEGGIHAQGRGQLSEAVTDFQQAAAIDDEYAEEHFRLGQCVLAQGDDKEAAKQFNLACDQDTLRFRTDSRINEIIRQMASNREKEGVQFVDSEAAVARQSPHGLPGEEFLYEHVHLNFEGNYVVARAIAEEIGKQLPDTGRAWPELTECADRLGWNQTTRRAGEKEILSRLNGSPFAEEAGSREQYQHLRQKMDALQSATLPETLRRERVSTETAAKAAPDDWIIQENLAQLQQETGDIPGAVKSLQRVAELLPQSADAWETLGITLEMDKRNDEAVAALRKSAELAPESVVSLNSLAELYARENHPEDASREFREVLRRKPYWGPAHLGLGKALEALGKTNEANAEFKEALVNRISTPDSFNTLAKFSFARGWYDAAVTNFTDSLRLFPSDPETHVNLGLALLKLGKRAEAKEHFVEAIRLQPNFAEAHFCLGLEIGRDGDPVHAAQEFAEAVRLKPDLIEARLNLGIALSNEHQNQQALEQFEQVLQRDPKNQVAQTYVNILRAPATAH